MQVQWLAAEHHRLHLVEEWPEGPRKYATLAAIRSTLAGLSRDVQPGGVVQVCEVCLSRKPANGVIQFPELSQIDNGRSNLAA